VIVWPGPTDARSVGVGCTGSGFGVGGAAGLPVSTVMYASERYGGDTEMFSQGWSAASGHSITSETGRRADVRVKSAMA
jgi:hypothetical protein